jgi:elongation factor 1-beta
MGTVAVKIKVMPDSPETDIKEIEEKVKETLEKAGCRNPQTEIQPIAFGLKALIILFGWPEEKELEEIEEKLRKTKSVGSVEVIDMRRAIG